MKSGSVRVKICGITRPEDADCAVRYGADAIGLVFADSPRRVSPAMAKIIARRARPFVSVIGVFVNESPKTMARIAVAAGLSAVQLHGEESPAVSRALSGICRIKAFRVDAGGINFSLISRYPAEWLLLDAAAGKLRGGSGRTWEWACASHQQSPKPWILSGGLTPLNVGEALRCLSPSAVDVSSGTESSPGKKDPRKIEAFIRGVRMTPNHPKRLS